MNKSDLQVVRNYKRRSQVDSRVVAERVADNMGRAEYEQVDGTHCVFVDNGEGHENVTVFVYDDMYRVVVDADAYNYGYDMLQQLARRVRQTFRQYDY